MTKAFTLLETMIALMILGVASGAVITVFSESLHRIRHSERAAHANALAQSLLARVEGGDISLSSAITQGEAENGFRWRLHTQAYGAAQDREAWAMQAQQLSATVSWDDGEGDGKKNHEKKQPKSVTLTTLRLVPKGM